MEQINFKISTTLAGVKLKYVVFRERKKKINQVSIFCKKEPKYNMVFEPLGERRYLYDLTWIEPHEFDSISKAKKFIKNYCIVHNINNYKIS